MSLYNLDFDKENIKCPKCNKSDELQAITSRFGSVTDYYLEYTILCYRCREQFGHVGTIPEKEYSFKCPDCGHKFSFK